MTKEELVEHEYKVIFMTLKKVEQTLLKFDAKRSDIKLVKPALEVQQKVIARLQESGRYGEIDEKETSKVLVHLVSNINESLSHMVITSSNIMDMGDLVDLIPNIVSRLKDGELEYKGAFFLVTDSF